MLIDSFPDERIDLSKLNAFFLQIWSFSLVGTLPRGKNNHRTFGETGNSDKIVFALYHIIFKSLPPHRGKMTGFFCERLRDWIAK